MIESNDDQELVHWEFTIPKELYDKLQTIWQSNNPNEDFAWSRLVMEAFSRYILIKTAQKNRGRSSSSGAKKGAAQAESAMTTEDFNEILEISLRLAQLKEKLS